jgi:L-cysteine/cystine lyase
MPTFPMLERFAYLNAGTFGPLAQETIDAVVAQTRHELEHGRSGAPYFDRLRALRTNVRRMFAELLGVSEAHIALTSSTTNGCQIVLAGLELGPEDEIVTTDEEHFGLLGPLHASGARVRVASTRARSPENALDAMLAEVTTRTRLVAISHVSWLTGNLLPVDAVKAETGLPLLVDGAQSAGAIPVEMGAADFYTVSGQKWLCGPDATGALYVADPEQLHVALPTYWSRDDHTPAGAFTPISGAGRFDSGTLPVPSLAGLEAALSDVPDSRFEAGRAAAAHCRSLLAERFDVVTAPDQATLVTFRPNGDAADTVARLFEAGVIVRDLPGTDWVRVSCGYWTSDDHLERLVEGLANR